MEIIRLQARTVRFNQKGWHVIRFWNNAFWNNEKAVLDKILETLQPSPRTVHPFGVKVRVRGLRAETLLQRPDQRLAALFQRHYALAHVFTELLEIRFLVLPLILDRGLQTAQAAQHAL